MATNDRAKQVCEEAIEIIGKYAICPPTFEQIRENDYYLALPPMPHMRYFEDLIEICNKYHCWFYMTSRQNARIVEDDLNE